MEKGRLSGSTFEFNPTLSDCNDGQRLFVPMSPADELFCNGRVRLMKPSSAVPQKTRLPNFEQRIKVQQSVISKKGDDVEENYKRNSSSHCERKGRRINSEKEGGVEGIKVAGAASPWTFLMARGSSRGSRRTWSLREIFLPRSKSEGRQQQRDEMEFYANLSSPDKHRARAMGQGKPAHKKMADTHSDKTTYIWSPNRKGAQDQLHYISSPLRRGVPISAHELHYTANRAQAEELRKKTFLPYRQGLFACLGFPSTPAFPRSPVLQPLY